MSDNDGNIIEFDIYKCLGKIEGKLDSIERKADDNNTILTNNNITIKTMQDNYNKIVLALIAIIGAQVGLEFRPQSPIDFLGGTYKSLQFLTVFAIIFTAMRMWDSRNNKHRSKQFRFLSLAFLGISIPMSILLIVGPTLPDWLNQLLIPLRLFNIFALVYYSWHINDSEIDAKIKKIEDININNTPEVIPENKKDCMSTENT